MNRYIAFALAAAAIIVLGDANLLATILVAGSAFITYTTPQKTRTLTKVRRVEVQPDIDCAELFVTAVRTVFAAQNHVNKQLRLIRRQDGSLWLGYGQGRGTVITHQLLPDEQQVILIGEDEVREEGAA